jgi:ankyrin repeat protein
MTKRSVFCCFLLLSIISAQAQDYSTMSMNQLDSAFVSAVKERSLEKIELLIKAGANIHTPIPYILTQGDCDWDVQSTAFMYAVNGNFADMVKILMKGEKNLNEALNIAIRGGCLDVVKELIQEGADINCVDENKNTPLIIAIKCACATAEFNTQANERIRSGWQKRREIIAVLLKAGADINHVNKYGRTALMEAIEQHDLNTVEQLLEIPEIKMGSFFGFGIKPINYADQDGNTALILAMKNIRYTYINSQEYNICKNSQKIANLLFETPEVDVYYINKKGETALKLFEILKEDISRYP